MFFKKKPIYLDCYTTQNHVYDFFKIASAKKHIPDWFKHLPSTYEYPDSIVPPSTIKTCSGLTSFFRNGVIIPLWSDAQIGYASISNGYTNTIQPVTQFSDQVTTCQLHEQRAMGEEFMPSDTYAHFKIFAPWVFDCSEDIDWVWTQPTYNFKYPDKLTVLPGLIEFKHNSNIFINCSIRKLDETNSPTLLHLDAGQPLVHLVPITDREVIIRNHLVTQEEWNRIYQKNNRVFFFNNHNKKRNLLKKHASSERSCPLGFKKK